MAVEIIQFERPKLWLSLVPGGSLLVGQEYFFFCFTMKGGGYYGAVTSQASEQVSITPTNGNQTIKVEWWRDGGSITSIANAGGGDITVSTSIAHGRSNGDTAYIRGTTNYDGTYIISNVTTSTYDVTTTYVSTETGSWFADIGYNSIANGVLFKWDYYTMIDGGDGKPYQWLNLNDPVNAAKAEFDDIRGHRRWSRRKYNTFHTGTSIDFTQESADTVDTNGRLYDGIALNSTLFSGDTQSLTDIAWREPTYPIDSVFTRDVGKLCIYLTGTGNTVRTLIDALKASSYDDMYVIGESQYNWNIGNSITILGGIFSESGAETEINDTALTLVGGQFCYSSYSSGEVITNRCSIFQHALSDSQWYNIEATFNDTVVMCQGNAFILDSSDGVGFTPRAYDSSMTYYNKVVSDVNLIGSNYPFVQWRYQRKDDTSSMTDVYIKDFYIYFVDDGIDDTTAHMTRVEFVNEGFQNFDVGTYWNNVDGDVDRVMECLDVTCDRLDEKVIVSCTNIGIRTWFDTWNMRFNVDMTVIDVSGEPIESATVILYWGDAIVSSDTDANGQATVTALSYQLTHSSADGTGNYTVSDYNNITLLITKEGYEGYIEPMVITGGVTKSIALQTVELEEDKAMSARILHITSDSVATDKLNVGKEGLILILGNSDNFVGTVSVQFTTFEVDTWIDGGTFTDETVWRIKPGNEIFVRIACKPGDYVSGSITAYLYRGYAPSEQVVNAREDY